MAGPARAVAQRPAVRVTVLDEYAVVRAWLNEKVANREMAQGEAETRLQEYEKNAKAWAPPLKDAKGDAELIVKLSRDMGTAWGRVSYKTYNGARYVIIKGNPRLRTIITGTRYRDVHPKMVEFQIGTAGLKAAARESFIFGAVFVTAIDIAGFLLGDKETMGELCGKIGMDIAKVAVASLVGLAAGAAVAAVAVVGTLAIGPLVVAFAVAVGVGIALDKLDEHFQLTQKLGKLLDEGFNKIDKLAHEKGAEFEAWTKRLETSHTVIKLEGDAEDIWREIKRTAASTSYMPVYMPVF